jgi:hypothetical protein
MDRRRFLLTSLAGVLAAPLAVGAQQAGTVNRIGYLGPTSASAIPRQLKALQDGLQELLSYASGSLPEIFRQGLRDLGYEEGDAPPRSGRGAS